MSREPTAQLDHLVVVAHDLDEGVAWCEATLGVTPGPGGRHARFGTHNRLVSLCGPVHDRAYLEVIAIDPQAPAPACRRWFDMDTPQLREQVARDGPRLAHWVARVPSLSPALATWRALGLAAGKSMEASRMTPQGELRWQIAVREDGARLLDGTLPTLIAWGHAHPTDTLPDAGLRLQALVLRHPRHGLLRDALDRIGLDQVAVEEGPPGLHAILATPRGEVRLD